MNELVSIEFSLIALCLEILLPFSQGKKEQMTFSVAIGNEDLPHECFRKHSHMGTASMKLDKDTEEEGKKKRVNMERSTVDMEKKKSQWQLRCSSFFMAYYNECA